MPAPCLFPKGAYLALKHLAFITVIGITDFIICFIRNRL